MPADSARSMASRKALKLCYLAVRHAARPECGRGSAAGAESISSGALFAGRGAGSRGLLSVRAVGGEENRGEARGSTKGHGNLRIVSGLLQAPAGKLPSPIQRLAQEGVIVKVILIR